MNVGERYVLTIADVFKGAESGQDKARVSGFDNLIFDDNGLGKLEKLEDVLQEACDNARHEGYEEGLKAAWKCARKITFCKQGELCNIFPEDDYDNFDLGWLKDYSASEAMAKVREYEINCAYEKELRIGDEVIVGNDKNGYLEAKFIVTGFNKEGSVYLLNRGSGGSTIAIRKGCHKTGKHFQQISQVLEKGDE